MSKKTIAIIIALNVCMLVFNIIMAFSSHEKKVDNTYNVSPWTLAKVCYNGTEIYQLADGDYAIFRGEDENNLHWVKLSKGVDPDDYCQ